MKRRIVAAIFGVLLLAACAAYVAVSLFNVELALPSTLLRGWGTLFLIIPGIIGLFQRGSRLSSAGLILLGAGIYCNIQEWFGLFDPTPDLKWWQMALAIVLLLAGIGLFGTAFGKKKDHTKFVTVDGNAVNVSGAGKSGQMKHTAVFSTNAISYAGKEFTGAELNGVFGTLEIDLRDAIIPADCFIEAAGVFGSVIIYDGHNANFDIVSNAVFGSVQYNDAAKDESLPTIKIEANAVFGSVEIK